MLKYVLDREVYDNWAWRHKIPHKDWGVGL